MCLSGPASSRFDSIGIDGGVLGYRGALRLGLVE